MSLYLLYYTSGGSDGIEEEYHKALATNIVQELLFQKRQVESAAKSPSPVKSTTVPGSDGRKSKVRIINLSLCFEKKDYYIETLA